jgi:hypothetical protein
MTILPCFLVDVFKDNRIIEKGSESGGNQVGF